MSGRQYLIEQTYDNNIIEIGFSVFVAVSIFGSSQATIGRTRVFEMSSEQYIFRIQIPLENQLLIVN